MTSSAEVSYCMGQGRVLGGCRVAEAAVEWNTLAVTSSGRQRESILEAIGPAATGLAVGLGINEISGSRFGHRATAAGVGVAAVVLVSNRVRRLPAPALLPSLVIWACLAMAMVGIVVAGFGPRNWSGYAVIAAAMLVTTAAMVNAERDRAFNLLRGTATIGLGVAMIGLGVAILDRDYLFGVAGIGLGVAAIGLGVASLLDRDYLGGVAVIGGGVAVIGLGVAWLLDRDYLFGVAAIGIGVAWLLDNPEVRRAADELRARLLGTVPHSDTDDASGR